jgi:pimeloyl-ACP methyl ester carboxylesterase
MSPRNDRTEGDPVILVHGAWLGEWCWNRVLSLLQAEGVETVAVPLTGHGVRRAEGGSHVTLTDHVADVVSAIDRARGDRVTLVGHSYGGRVITRVAAEISERIGRLVYLDAHAPTAPDVNPIEERRAVAAANGGMIPFSGFGVDDSVLDGEMTLDRFLAGISDQSFATLDEQWQSEPAAHIHLDYIAVDGPESAFFAPYAEGAAANPRWHVHRIAGPHLVTFAGAADITRIITRDA